MDVPIPSIEKLVARKGLWSTRRNRNTYFSERANALYYSVGGYECKPWSIYLKGAQAAELEKTTLCLSFDDRLPANKCSNGLGAPEVWLSLRRSQVYSAKMTVAISTHPFEKICKWYLDFWIQHYNITNCCQCEICHSGFPFLSFTHNSAPRV